LNKSIVQRYGEIERTEKRLWYITLAFCVPLMLIGFFLQNYLLAFGALLSDIIIVFVIASISIVREKRLDKELKS